MQKRTCSIEGCERPAGVPGSARGWCRAHYRRWQTYGDVHEPMRKAATWAGRTCAATIEQCTTAAHSLGLCEKHYSRLIRLGRLDLPAKVRKVCSVEGCDRAFYGKELCRKHFDAQRGPRLGKSNPERERHRAKHRRAVLKGAAGAHTLDEWKQVLHRHQGRCAYCSGQAETKDHVVPVSRGGSDFIDNIVPACRSCNSSKGNNPLAEWLEWRKVQVSHEHDSRLAHQ